MREFIESSNLDDIPSKELMLQTFDDLWTYLLESTRDKPDHADIIRLRPYFYSMYVTAWARAKSDSIQKMITAGKELRGGIKI